MEKVSQEAFSGAKVRLMNAKNILLADVDGTTGLFMIVYSVPHIQSIFCTLTLEHISCPCHLVYVHISCISRASYALWDSIPVRILILVSTSAATK